MQQNKRRISMVFLILGMALLMIGFSTDNKAFTFAAIACVLISLITGGRWMRPRKK
ncbi:MAG: hypothetical protein HZB50_12210 [Chloroflexi bacterium]|nr:hypothetical protein [Chloroflexota bacterium]